MDINNTKFHLLNGRDDWESQIVLQDVRDLWWDNQQSFVTLLPEVLQYPNAPGSETLSPANRCGAARDRYGNFFWIADTVGDGGGDTGRAQRVDILPACEQGSGVFWSLTGLVETPTSGSEQDFSPLPVSALVVGESLRGLAITRENYLVVGTLNPGGLLVFDLHAGGPPLILRWPEAVNFRPFDMAPAADGGLWVLDWDGTPTGGRLWRLDRHMRVCNFAGNTITDSGGAGDFTPLNPPTVALPECIPVSEVTAQWALSLPERNPLALIGLDDDSVLILSDADDAAYSAVARYNKAQRTDFFELRGGVLEEVFPGAVIKCHDFAFVSQPASIQYTLSGELSLVLQSGDQALIFVLTVDDEGAELSLQPRFVPLRRFGGKALVSGGDGVYYDIGGQWFPLVGQPRRRYAQRATLHLQFDGKEAHCQWHRILMDACIPDGTQVLVASRAADELADLPHANWHTEASPYRRATGSEIPFFAGSGAGDVDQDNGLASWEWVFHHARGRYLELAFTLQGNTRQTPKVRALRVYYPRFSWLNRFLPAIYREQGEYSEFLDRYLANVEGILTGLEGSIAKSETLFDTRTTPDEYLDWLAAWLGGVMDGGWDSRRKRLFIDHAELLFRWRGTRIGMGAALRLALNDCVDPSIFQELLDQRHYNPMGAGGEVIRIVERFSLRRLPGVVVDGNAATGALPLAQVSGNLSELGDRHNLSQRYREYLYWRYSQVAGDGDAMPIERLNLHWNTAFISFYDIVFRSERPQQAGELSDWTQFVRRELARSTEWSPEQGVFALHVRYQEWLREKYAREFGESEALRQLNTLWNSGFSNFESILFSPVVPLAAGKAADWLHFIDDGIGFTYSSVSSQHANLYQEFLARRYRRIEALNSAYGRSGANQWPSFDAVALPAEDALPESGKALADWIQFVSLMLPIRASAHRFTVLVPTTPGELPAQRERRMAQAEKVVRLEKPAHTSFDVKLFWALFQVGSARLGTDTIVGEGARYVGVVLGGTYLGQGIVQSSHPWDIRDRHLVGRDRLGSQATP